MSNPFPPQNPLPPLTQFSGPQYSPPYSTPPSNVLTIGANWLAQQSPLVVVLTLGILGMWFVGNSHLSEIKAMRSEDKLDAKEDKQAFLQALRECCREGKAAGVPFASKP